MKWAASNNRTSMWDDLRASATSLTWRRLSKPNLHRSGPPPRSTKMTYRLASTSYKLNTTRTRSFMMKHWKLEPTSLRRQKKNLRRFRPRKTGFKGSYRMRMIVSMASRWSSSCRGKRKPRSVPTLHLRPTKVYSIACALSFKSATMRSASSSMS